MPRVPHSSPENSWYPRKTPFPCFQWSRLIGTRSRRELRSGSHAVITAYGRWNPSSKQTADVRCRDDKRAVVWSRSLCYFVILHLNSWSVHVGDTYMETDLGMADPIHGLRGLVILGSSAYPRRQYTSLMLHSTPVGTDKVSVIPCP